ncbi:ATP-binding cassette domain-containing protein, partial [Kitasatospora sp. NPDC001574]
DIAAPQPSRASRGIAPASDASALAESAPATSASDAPASGAPLLDVDRITKSFAGRQVVREVSFRLHAGETLGLVGESGSGKTTAARIVLGLERRKGAQQPPATAGMIETLAPSLISVARPSANRTSSSFT